MKRQPTDWKKTFVNFIIDKWLVFTVYKEFLQVKNNKSNNPVFKKWAKDLKRYITKEDIDSK